MASNMRRPQQERMGLWENVNVYVAPNLNAHQQKRRT